MDTLKDDLIKACNDLLNTADDTGCSDDLMVVGSREVSEIKKVLKRMEDFDRELLAKMYQYGGG